MKFGVPLSFFLVFFIWEKAAFAHVSERALVLILPTNIYIAFGVAAVAVTIFLTVLVPPSVFGLLGDEEAPTPKAFSQIKLQTLASLISLCVFCTLICIGIFGPRDPLQNLLPLTLFTVWWIFFPIFQAVLGDLWSWINPWFGAVQLVFKGRYLKEFPVQFGVWPAIITYFMAAVYTLTDLAPDDPDRLAIVATGYWLFTFMMCGVFGKNWLHRGEGFTVFFNLLAQLSLSRSATFGLRFPGQIIISQPPQGLSVALFAIILLALGSFDGLNETFWWMSQLGINPLEFPGRSAIAWQNRFGMFGAIVLLTAGFAGCVWGGLALISQTKSFKSMFCRLSLSLIPIALGYHLAHFLTTAMVNLQYLLAALNDPFETGMALLGWDRFYVTTSFFNQHQTVKAIWLTQAGTIVLAHIIAVILAHMIALKAFDDHWLAVASQLPVAAFMLLYTVFGLWLLASPVAL
ncbi:MAG: hypothetical protein P8M25_07600 [Paracoccaceae bacterium]|nr:hypothetical protein [Paracoccaceae bacterium]